MAGLFPGICNTQNVDVNGQPLAGAVLTVYQGGTLTLTDCFQDIGLAIVAQNPMTADATGRLPIFFVADGTYRIRLVDQYGVLIFDYPQVPAIGASSSGGGGSAVDPTTIFQTGDAIWIEADGVRTGFVRDNGLTIGSALSGATERANVDCQNLFLYGWAKAAAGQPGWSVVGGAGASAAADWAANKQITLPDKRGCGIRGLDTMGNVAAGLFTGVPFVSGNATVAGSICGENTHQLLNAELPIITLTFNGTPVTPTGNVNITDPGHTTTGLQTVTLQGAGVGGGQSALQAGGGGHLGPDFTGITATFTGNALTPAGAISPFGANGSHNTVARDVLGTFYRKL